jgi:hypothetical protein
MDDSLLYQDVAYAPNPARTITTLLGFFAQTRSVVHPVSAYFLVRTHIADGMPANSWHTQLNSVGQEGLWYEEKPNEYDGESEL